ncbi:MAG: saccharopine dehydrogenase NADP-binding domain-containing protein, partial [Bacteroidales bacterium]|nr:saccharopine dehydrogenase NADP-binding domain-containing protein [Bacteroidales bacterium]
MSRVLIIGAGGVATVVAHKVASHPEVFDDVMIASRTKSKCDAIVKSLESRGLKKAQWQTAAIDADNVPELTALLQKFKPELVI